MPLEDTKGIRVGQEGSLVKPGDAVPGQMGKVYEAGQFSPSIDELASMTLSEAKHAGLISRELPIFDPETGEIDKDALEAWNPYGHLRRYGAYSSVSVPKHSMAVVVSIADTFPKLLEGLNVSNILNGQGTDVDGDALVTSTVTAKNNNFRSNLVIYPEFYKYVSIPIVPEIPGVRSGLSVATYATVHALGHVLYSKLVFEHELSLLGTFMSAAGWSRKETPGYQPGSYLGKTNNAPWKRDTSKVVTSEISRFSPSEDFADTFAQYMFHREYLRIVSPEKLHAMEDIVEQYRLDEEF